MIFIFASGYSSLSCSLPCQTFPKSQSLIPDPCLMARMQRLDPAFEPADAFIGIATNMPVIQLVHYINSQTLLKLVRENDLPVYSEKSDTLIEYKFFHYQDDDYRSIFCLLSNSSTSGLYLLPAHKQFSYFLVIQGAIPEERVTQLVARIKSIAGVQLAAVIKQEPIKILGPVLQDLEIHLTQLNKEKAEKQKRIMPLAEDQ